MPIKPERERQGDSLTAGQLPLQNRDWLWLGVVVGAALVVRLVYLMMARGEIWLLQPVVDAQNYHFWAREILKGDILGQGVFLHSPLYAFFLAGMYGLAGSANVVFAISVQLCLGALSCGLIYLLGRRLFSRTAGLLAGLIAAFYGMSIFYEGTLLTALLIHLFNLLMLLTAYRAAARPARPLAWLLPGLMLGLSALTRPNVILMILVLGAWIWFTLYPRESRKKAVVALAALCLASGSLLGLATLRNGLVMNEFLLSVGNGGLNFYLGNRQGANGYHVPLGKLGLSASEQVIAAKTQAEQTLGRALTYGQSSRFWTGQALDEIRKAPYQWARLVLRKSLLTFNRFEYTTSLNYSWVRERFSFFRGPWLGFGLIAPLALLGMILFWRQWRFLWPLYGLVACIWFSNVLLLVSSEYRYAFMPVFFIFAGAGIEKLYNRLRARQWRELTPAVAGLLGLAIICNLRLVSTDFLNYYKATGQNQMGALFAQLGDLPGAAREFAQARVLLREQPVYRAQMDLQLGKVLLQGSKYQEALDPLYEAYTISPEDPDLANTYANALTANGKYSDALKIRRDVVNSEPGNPEYWVNLGITHLWTGNDQEAGLAFARARAINPDLARAIQQTWQGIIQQRQRSSNQAK